MFLTFKRFFALVAVLAFYFPMSLRAADVTDATTKDDGLLFYYSFDKDDGDMVKDLSGNDRDAVVKGGQWEAKGKTGGGWRCSESVDQPMMVDCSSFPELKAYTIELWVYLDKQPPDNFGRFFEEGQHCGFIVNPVNQNSTLMSYVTFDGTNREDASITSTALSLNEWHHVVNVWDGKVNQIWVDGVKQAEQERVGNLSLPWLTAYIGWILPGVIDEFKFYSRALGEQEIKGHFTKMTGKSLPENKVKSAAGSPNQDSLPHFEAWKSHYPGVKTEEDVKIGTGGGRALHANIAFPAEPPQKLMPAIIWVHGGAWQGDSQKLNKAMFFATRGYFTASIEYRLSGEAKWPAQIEDCKLGVRWLRANAEKYHVDSSRIAVWGESAGGHLVSCLGTLVDTKFEGQGGYAGVSSKVQAVINWYGPADLCKLKPTSLFGVPYEQGKDLYRDASPIFNIRPNLPPFLIVHGDADAVIPYSYGVDFYDALKKAGVAAELMTVSGGDHGFGPAKGAPLPQRNIQEVYTEVIMRMLDFLNKNLK